jgi:hypothetical protein
MINEWSAVMEYENSRHENSQKKYIPEEKSCIKMHYYIFFQYISPIM